MIRYVVRAFLAHVEGSRILALLCVFGVALGTSSVVAVRLISANAVGAFAGSLAAVMGDAEISVIGDAATFDERVFPAVLGTEGVREARPVIRARATLPDRPGSMLEIVGIDPFTVGALPPDRDIDVIATPRWAVVSDQLARNLVLEPGDTLVVANGVERLGLVVVAALDFGDLSPLASPTMVFVDIADAQRRFGARGVLSEIHVSVAPGIPIEDVARRLEARLGPRFTASTASERRDDTAQLLSAFRLNLTAMSLISVLVGGFLIFAAVRASLGRRRREVGVLRVLGASRLAVAGTLLAEAVALGLAGGLLGLPLAIVAADASVDRVSATLTNVYLLNEIRGVRVSGATVAFGLLLALVVPILATLGPTLELVRRPPRTLLSPGAPDDRLRRWSWRLFGLGTAVAAGVLIALASGAGAWTDFGFVLALGVLIALVSWTPMAVRLVCERVQVTALGWSMGVRSLVARLSASSVAVAALATSVSMLLGVTIMVASFRETLVVWLDATLRADVYVTPAAWSRGAGAPTMTEDVLEVLAAPPVRAVDTLRQTVLRIGGRPVSFAGIGFGVPFDETRLRLAAGSADVAIDALDAARGILISEPLARRLSLGPGDTLDVPGVRPARLPIAAVYHDYASESGAVIMARPHFDRVFGPGATENVALYLERGEDADRTVERLRAALPDVPLEIRSNARIRGDSLEIFDQTFAITRLLQVLALVVAATGVTSTLVITARERRAEFALLRCLGGSRRQLGTTFLSEGIGIGALGTALGSVGGVLFAVILVFVINRAHFGWTIRWAWPWSTMAFELAVVLLAAALASIYPALGVSRTPATELGREVG